MDPIWKVVVVALKSKQNRAKEFDIHSKSFIQQVNIGLILLLHATALVTFSFNKTFESLLHSLVIDGINHATQDPSLRTVRLYI